MTIQGLYDILTRYEEEVIRFSPGEFRFAEVNITRLTQDGFMLLADTSIVSAFLLTKDEIGGVQD